MNIRTLQRGLQYCGRVEAVRQTYHVFESEGYFFVLSFALSKARRGSGYFNLVDKAAVDYVHERVGGMRGVTANHVLAAARRTKQSHQAPGTECPVRPGRAALGTITRAANTGNCSFRAQGDASAQPRPADLTGPAVRPAT